MPSKWIVEVVIEDMWTEVVEADTELDAKKAAREAVKEWLSNSPDLTIVVAASWPATENDEVTVVA